jgi:hypothetical protein
VVRWRRGDFPAVRFAGKLWKCSGRPRYAEKVADPACTQVRKKSPSSTGLSECGVRESEAPFPPFNAPQNSCPKLSCRKLTRFLPPRTTVAVTLNEKRVFAPCGVWWVEQLMSPWVRSLLWKGHEEVWIRQMLCRKAQHILRLIRLK